MRVGFKKSCSSSWLRSCLIPCMVRDMSGARVLRDMVWHESLDLWGVARVMGRESIYRCSKTPYIKLWVMARVLRVMGRGKSPYLWLCMARILRVYMGVVRILRSVMGHGKESLLMGHGESP